MKSDETDLTPPPPVDESGKFEFNRFTSVSRARTVLKRLDKDDESNAKDRSSHKDFINGHRPYNAARLKAMGQGWRCNVNFREGESIRDMNAGAYWSMMNDVPYFIDVTFKDPSIDPTQAMFWSRIIGEEYTDMLNDWEAWHYNANLVIQDFLIPGMSGFHFKSKLTWHPSGVRREDIRVKMNDPSNPEGITMLFIRDRMAPHALYKMTESAEQSQKMGWKSEVIEKVLLRKYIDKTLSKGQSNGIANLERMKQNWKDGIFLDPEDELSDLDVVWFYVREPDGKFSEYIFVEDEEIPDYLYENKNAYSKLTDFFIPFFYTIGDGDAGSVRGLGNRIFGLAEYSNRLTCGIMDGVWLYSSFMVKNAGGMKRALTIERIGPITVLPSDVEPINVQFNPQFSQLAEAKGMLERMQMNNNGIYRKTQVLPDGKYVSATADRNAAERETQFTGQQVANFYLYWGMLHKQILKRLLASGWTTIHEGYEARTEFMKNCERRGVPKDLLSFNAIKVDIMQSIGSGSSMMKKISSNRLLGMSGSFDEIGRQNTLVDAVAAEVGYRRAARYVSGVNRNMIPTNETSIATLENSVMSMGKPVAVGTDQKHLLHALTHLQPLMETVQQYIQSAQVGQAMDPRPLVPFWIEAVQHVGDHINRMRMDKRYDGDVSMLEKAMAQIMPIVKKGMEVAQSQNESDQAVQQAQLQSLAQNSKENAALQLKIQELQGRLAIEAQKAKVDSELKIAKATQQMQLKQAAADQKLQIRAQEHGMPAPGTAVQPEVEDELPPVE